MEDTICPSNPSRNTAPLWRSRNFSKESSPDSGKQFKSLLPGIHEIFKAIRLNCSGGKCLKFLKTSRIMP